MNLSAEAALFSILRLRMVEMQLRERGIRDERVLGAMTRVPRHEFTPQGYRNQAYEDHPLPISKGQTISQPYIVALMLEALALTPGDKVLEVGTGSGYVTALLAELAAQVVSVERHATLADEAREVLDRLAYANVRVIAGDGGQGFPACAPYVGPRRAACTARATCRRRSHDYPRGPRGLAAVAIDPDAQRQAADYVARDLPVCAVGSGRGAYVLGLGR